MGSPVNFKVCPNCRTTLMLSAIQCTQCGMELQPPHSSYDSCPRPQRWYPQVDPNRWIIALLLAFFLGSFGVHRFYMGYNGIGAIMMILTVIGLATACIGIGFIICTAVGLWAFVEFIVICCNGMPMADGSPLK